MYEPDRIFVGYLAKYRTWYRPRYCPQGNLHDTVRYTCSDTVQNIVRNTVRGIVRNTAPLGVGIPSGKPFGKLCFLFSRNFKIWKIFPSFRPSILLSFRRKANLERYFYSLELSSPSLCVQKHLNLEKFVYFITFKGKNLHSTFRI